MLVTKIITCGGISISFKNTSCKKIRCCPQKPYCSKANIYICFLCSICSRNFNAPNYRQKFRTKRISGNAQKIDIGRMQITLQNKNSEYFQRQILHLFLQSDKTLVKQLFRQTGVRTRFPIIFAGKNIYFPERFFTTNFRVL